MLLPQMVSAVSAAVLLQQTSEIDLLVAKDRQRPHLTLLRIQAVWP
jgi:uncharacterized protein YccT (UPF0319 family)